MRDKTEIANATYIDDISGLKLDTSKPYTMQEIYLYEAKNITKATLKYLSATPDKKLAPFSYEWFMILHRDMFGDVWEWAGKLRQVELSIGVKAYLVGMEIKKLVDDLESVYKALRFKQKDILPNFIRHYLKLKKNLHGRQKYTLLKLK